jgi:hypothetical protein
MSGNEMLHKMNKEEDVQFYLAGNSIVVLTNTNLNDLTTEIQALLDEFVDIIVDE